MLSLCGPLQVERTVVDSATPELALCSNGRNKNLEKDVTGGKEEE
jgi:hypothetical protein